MKPRRLLFFPNRLVKFDQRSLLEVPLPHEDDGGVTGNRIHVGAIHTKEPAHFNVREILEVRIERRSEALDLPRRDK